jgi:hypothetical protein
MNNKIRAVHHFQSTDGFIGDRVCLYNFFRSLPAASVPLRSSRTAPWRQETQD